MLLKVARDTAFDGLLKIEKGKITYKITAINRRHKSSLLLPATSILSSANNQWNIQSNSSKAVYTVTLDEPECSLKCSLRCNICKICVHISSCTCLDSLITATICHLVALHNSSNHTSSATNPAITNTITAVETTVDSDAVLSCLHDEDEIYSQLATKLAYITVKIPSCSVITLGPVEKHINAIISLINTDQYQQTVSASLNTSMPEPSNKQIPKQKPFSSTRKHNKSPQLE